VTFSESIQENPLLVADTTCADDEKKLPNRAKRQANRVAVFMA